jgi:aspartyl-tRNA(Asn)/glutamyl-tRNA(Gln) amidotransferase subunit B
MPGMLPVINEECVAPGGAHRSWAEGADQQALDLRPQELLLSRTCRRATRSASSRTRSSARARSRSRLSAATASFEIEIGIERLHLEQDAGKSMHDQHPTMSYVDLNRSGVALMEIVSKPDMRSSDEAKAYMTKLRYDPALPRHLRRQHGARARCAPTSTSPCASRAAFGTRCEIKNVNSIRFIGQAIEYEARRQIGIIEDGGSIDQETRLFDPGKGETRSMRSKEEAHDYRYFPDPDLLPLEFDQAFVDELKPSICPNCPTTRRRASSLNSASPSTTLRYSSRKRRLPTISKLWLKGRDGKTAANWVINELLGRLEQGRQGASPRRPFLPPSSAASST